MNNTLILNQISVSYQQKNILKDLSFNAFQGEHLSVMGSSGSGKSTLLKAIYGLFDLDSGEIFFEEKQCLGPSFNIVAGHQQMKYLAQDFGLMPYISVRENVGKFLSNLDLQKKNTRIDELLHLVNMQDFKNEKTLSLSGGEKQRVALAMALAHEPKILLLDEAFNQIDNFLKNRLRRDLFSYLKEKNITCISATHDAQEALQFSDRILILENGSVKHINTPQELYQNPRDTYTASLLGDYSLMEVEGKKQILFPDQIKIVAYQSSAENITNQAVVKNSYFLGDGFLIEAKNPYTIIYIKHPEAIQKNKEIHFIYELS